MVYICQMFDAFFRLYTPPDPRHPLHTLYMYIATFNCPKGILGLGGGGKHLKSNWKTPMKNVTILSIFRTHAQKEYRKV